jgi:LysR family hydrogen peroxide-inducible transcriptional activator
MDQDGLYERHFAHGEAPNLALLRRLDEVDGRNRVALLAVGADDTAIGHAEYVATDGIAEFALIVIPGLRDRGVGRALLAALIEQGIRAGLAAMTGIILATNTRALQLSRKLGFCVQPGEDRRTVIVSRPLCTVPNLAAGSSDAGSCAVSSEPANHDPDRTALHRYPGARAAFRACCRKVFRFPADVVGGRQEAGGRVGCGVVRACTERGPRDRDRGAPGGPGRARALAEAGRVAEIAAAGKDPLAGPLRLGCIYTIAPYLLPRLVPLMKDRAPAMPLIIEENLTARLIEKVKGGELDVAVLALPIEEPGLVAQPVYDEVFRALCPVGYAWCKQKAIDPASLLDAPLLMLGPGNCFRDQVLDLCGSASREAGSSPQILEGSSLETIRLMVASGVGVSVMPASAVDGISAKDPLLRVKPFIEPQPTRQVGLVWRSSFPRGKAIDILRKALIDSRLPGTRPVGR